MNSTEPATSGVGELIFRYRTIIKQGIWVVAGQAVTGLLTLGGTRLVTQFVSPELYGLVNLWQNSLVLLRTLFCSPTLNAGLRYFPEAERGHYVSGLRAYLARSLRLATVPMELLTIGAGAWWCWRKGVPLGFVLALALFVAADVGRTLEMSLLNAARRQRPAAVLGAAESLLRPLMIVAGVWIFGPRIDVVFAALAISIVVTWALLIFGSHPVGGGPKTLLPDGTAAAMGRYAMPLIPIALMTWLTSVSDRYIIEGISHDTASVGIYAAGYGLVSQPFLLVHGVVALTLRPAYFAAVAAGNDGHARRMFRIWLMISGSVCLVAATVAIVARDWLAGVFLGPRYHGAAEFIPWIAAGYCFYVLEQVLEQHLLAYKQTIAVLVAQSSGAFASVAVTVPAVLKYGPLGAAYACPVYFAFQCLVVALLFGRSRAADRSEPG